MGTYEVKAELIIDDKKARKAIARIQKSLGSLIKQLDTVNKKMARMGTTMARVQRQNIGGSAKAKGTAGVGPGSYMMAGAALGGLALGARAIAGQVSAASDFRKEMEMGQIGLATIYNLVEKMPLDASLARASEQMIKFNQMAAEAPGSGRDMMSIYSRLYGPMKKLGVEASVIEQAVKGAAVMGKVMDVKDIGSLGRDVEEMLTGRAGKRTTKIFAIANALGLLNMEAREFNALAPEKRLKVTLDLIANFTAHGERMAKTWEGSSDAFGDWFNVVRDFAAAGFFTQLGEQLYRLNEAIEANLPRLRQYMDIASAKGGNFMAGVGTMGGAAGRASGVNPLVGGEAAIAGGLVAGVAALAVFTAMMGKFLLPAAAIAKLGAVVASIGLGPILAIVAAALVGIVAAFQLVMNNADTLGRFLAVSLGGALGITLHILSSAFWAIVAATRAVISILINVLEPAFSSLWRIGVILGTALLVVVEGFRILTESLSALFGSFDGMDKKAASMELFLQKIKLSSAFALIWMTKFFSSLLMFLSHALKIVSYLPGGGGSVSRAMGEKAAMWSKEVTGAGGNAVERILGLLAPGIGAEVGGAAGGEAGGAFNALRRNADYDFDDQADKAGKGKKFQGEPQINVQRMIINQEFKGKADPDRVVAAFKRSITDQAEGALSSPFDNHGRA